MREKGFDPYPHSFHRSHSFLQVRDAYDHQLTVGETLEVSSPLSVAGRMVTYRSMGKAAFFHLQDEKDRLQVYLRKEDLSERDRELLSLVDIGDILGIEGHPFKTRKGELTVRAQKIFILCKSTEPLPEKFHGITDTELRYRQRYLHLISDPKVKEIFFQRSFILKAIRSFLDDRGFMEVETPVLQPIYGGAAAHPFTTHHRSLDRRLFMKISPELYLKRLIIGGYDKVYELGKNFRNEGIDRNHNPEFTMVEWYEAYTDYLDQMNRFETLIPQVARSLKGTTKITYQGRELDLTPPWSRLSIKEGLQKYAKVDIDTLSDRDLVDKIKALGADLKKGMLREQMLLSLFSKVVEPQLWNPTFVVDFPVEVSPLAKGHRDREAKAGYVEQFDLFIAGMEVGTAYSELNDPEEQERRLQEQEERRGVDEESHPMDRDFLHAVGVGMPPTGGAGLGVERLVMLLTDTSSIRDILFFPTLRDK